MRTPKALCPTFNFHPELCIGCGACVTACMDEHDAFPATAEPLRRLYQTQRLQKGAGMLTWYSLACLHCDERGCMAACPKSCFAEDIATGTVQLDSTNCIGCKACARACRLKGIVFTEENKAAKCDGCLERLRQRLSPRCVEACPRYAITIDDRPAVRQNIRQKLAHAVETQLPK